MDAIFTLARHVQLKIMTIPLFKTKCYQILVSEPFDDVNENRTISVTVHVLDFALVMGDKRLPTANSENLAIFGT